MENNEELYIERCETGFIACENRQLGVISRKWAFEAPENLAEFIAEWGNSANIDDT